MRVDLISDSASEILDHVRTIDIKYWNYQEQIIRMILFNYVLLRL